MDDYIPQSLKELLAEPKGKTTFREGEAFLLQVFWEVPTTNGTDQLLNALQQCADATNRDTPCVPTYYFRKSALEADTVRSVPRTVADHAQLVEARRKLEVGVPEAAVRADLARRGIDVELLHLPPDHPLPNATQESPVIIECTELYLDQRSFFEHAGSKDYLDAYGKVMSPGLQNRQVTVRMGTPTSYIQESILVPMLKEEAQDLPTACKLWRAPSTPTEGAVLLAMNVVGAKEEVAPQLPLSMTSQSTTCVIFKHPLRPGIVRVMAILSAAAMVEVAPTLSVMALNGVEVHCDATSLADMGQRLHEVSPGTKFIVSDFQAGYVLHPRAGELRCAETASENPTNLDR